MTSPYDSRTPQNTGTCLYILGDTLSLGEIIEAAKAHFVTNIEIDDLRIGSEHFHARCLTYDQYDPSDYDNYITIERN